MQAKNSPHARQKHIEPRKKTTHANSKSPTCKTKSAEPRRKAENQLILFKILISYLCKTRYFKH